MPPNPLEIQESQKNEPQLELYLTKKQEVEFHSLAPDEPEARVAYERDHPRLVEQRRQLIASLTLPEDLFDGDDGSFSKSDETTAEAEVI